MPVEMGKKEDIRSIRTEKALNTAMFSLLEKHNFKKITVQDICAESLISRATFYSRFTDKYDFLKWWVIDIWPYDLFDENEDYKTKEEKINNYIFTNKSIITHLFLDADSWTLDALFDVLCFVMRLDLDKTTDSATDPEYITLSNFYIGGMIQYIFWQAKNGFPKYVSAMNIYLNRVIEAFHNLFDMS